MDIVFILTVLLIVGGAAKGLKNGAAEEAGSAVSLALALAAAAMIIVAVQGYVEHEALRLILGIICLTVTSLVYKIADLLLTSIELISKLPVINGFDRVAGLVVGVAEAVAIIWICFIMTDVFGFWGLSDYVKAGVKGNIFLKFMYNNNYILKLMALAAPTIRELEKMGLEALK